MFKYVYVLVCLAVLFGIGYSQNPTPTPTLNCYKCNSETIDGCSKGAKPTRHDCGYPPEGFLHFCYYKTAYDVNRKMHYSNSSCLAVPLGTLLEKSAVRECTNPPPNTDILECRVCANDLCNSATIVGTSLWCLPVIYLFSKIMH